MFIFTVTLVIWTAIGLTIRFVDRKLWKTNRRPGGRS